MVVVGSGVKMAIIKIEVDAYICENPHCNHTWTHKSITSKDIPLICPICKRSTWNNPLGRARK